VPRSIKPVISRLLAFFSVLAAEAARDIGSIEGCKACSKNASVRHFPRLTSVDAGQQMVA